MVVLGAGIIGLCTSLALLRADPGLRVVLLDSKMPCAGATGAGQGYLWLAHRDVGSPAYAMAARSREMWAQLLAPTVPQLTQAAVEWQVRRGGRGMAVAIGGMLGGPYGCVQAWMATPQSMGAPCMRAGCGGSRTSQHALYAAGLR